MRERKYYHCNIMVRIYIYLFPSRKFRVTFLGHEHNPKKNPVTFMANQIFYARSSLLKNNTILCYTGFHH